MTTAARLRAIREGISVAADALRSDKPTMEDLATAHEMLRSSADVLRRIAAEMKREERA